MKGSPPGSDVPLRDKITLRNFWKHLQVGALPLLVLPVLALYGLCTTNVHVNTIYLSIFYYMITTMSITAGYHRLFSHKSYTSSWLLKLLLLCVGAGTVEGSCKWWVRGHRAHHRFSDTNQDPYGVHEGFFHAHFGWMIFTPRFKPGYVDMTDIKQDKLVQWQHNNFLALLLIFAFVIPLAVAGLGWDDWRGGFFYACCLRLTLAHHATFCVNSVAHYLGEASYDDARSPRDHFITALITNGEGYHNFHHEFPNDYRNAIRWYQYDPTKLFIWSCSKVGLAGNLNRTGGEVVKKSALQMEQKKLDKKKEEVSWPRKRLPVMSISQFNEEALTRPLVICNDWVHDISGFSEQHPGGKNFIKTNLGKDITSQFRGAVYKHSNAANNILDMMRIARLQNEDEALLDLQVAKSPLSGLRRVHAAA